MSKVIARARADVEAGRLWKARDRLYGALVGSADHELLALLGDVLYAMGDLPAAGAAWFATNRMTREAAAADQAWRERHGDDPLELWRSLPPVVRMESDGSVEVKALRRQAEKVTSERLEAGRAVPRGAPRSESFDWGCLVFASVALSVLVIFGIGVWTAVRWLLG